MSATLEIVPSVLDRIRRTLVGLKMPRALEVLDQTMRQLERGEASALEVIDTLFAEELTLRENRRIKMALRMAKLSTIKTLAGFDFSFQPSLDRNRSRPCSARLHRSQRGDPLPRPTGNGQEPPRHCPWRRGREGRP
jgi:DNA replication protein DnaC